MIDVALQLPLSNGLPGGIDSASDAGQKIVEQFGLAEWLGPLAPVALSPFFGLSILSGIATYGPDWMQQQSLMLGDGSPLNSPLLFWTLLALAIVTSLPRLTKVSKPVALYAEKLEAYSAIIILLVVRILGSSATGSTETPAVVLSAGLGSLSLDLVMSIAAALNILVINVVKLFFEFLIWVIPVPFIDAGVELLNKTVCAGLMSLYCYNPALAAGLDLVLVILAAMVFGWIYRRLRFYREVVCGPVLAWLFPGMFAQREQSFVAFCETPLAGLPRFAMVTVKQLSHNEFELDGRWLWRRVHRKLSNCEVVSFPGLLIQKLSITSGSERIEISHRRWVSSDALHSSQATQTQTA